MNNSSHDMSTSQPQRSDGNALGEFFDNGLQSYANYQPDAEPSQDDFNMWDPSLFTNPQMYSPPVATHTSTWNQNPPTQSQDPPITGYGGLQSSFQLNQYGQPNQQQGHDPRLIPRPSHSPAQFNNIDPQATMGYRDLAYSNQQQFNPQSMVYPQRPASTSTPTFDGHANRNPYFNYDPHMAGQPQLHVSFVFHRHVTSTHKA